MKPAPIRSLARDPRGTATVEYVVLLACFSVGIYAAWGAFGKQIIAIIAGD